jgi:polysaccharide export outer membrane protein
MMIKLNRTYIYLVLFFFFVISCYSFGQIKGLSQFDTENLLQEGELNNADINKISRGERVAVGNVIQPDFYYVGPGDILAISNLSASVYQQYVTISPENSILLPRIGEISLMGKTLKQARDTILQIIYQRNPSTMAFVSLYQPRTVLVTINGNVINPGTQVMPASYNLSTALKMTSYLQTSNRSSLQESIALTTYNDKRQQREKLLSESGLPEMAKYGLRNIYIKHSDGTYIIADLMKAIAFTNYSLNPYIREGDEIYVPFEPDNFPIISIGGAVQHPGILPFKKGDMASLLLKLCGGFKDYADESNVYLYTTDTSEKIHLDLDSNMQLQGKDYELLPGSMIIVGQKPLPPIPNNGLVSVSGCVKNPGVYPIEIGKTTLRDFINIAGGFTNDAYLPLAKIVRRDKDLSYSSNTRKDIDERFQYSDLTLEDTTRFNIDMNMRQPVVSCDFVSVFYKNSDKDNILLRDGDLIIVPTSPGNVFVYGQVNKPGYLTFEKNENMDYYIKLAGGYAVGGKSARARIIRGINKTWVEGDNDVMVYAGDEIYVPRSRDVPAGTDLQTWSLIAGTIGAAAALMNVIIFGLIKK